MTTLSESQEACRRLTKATAKNFGVTFCVLPRDQARDMETLYAFMRHTDDLADRDTDAKQRRDDLDEWRQLFHQAVAEPLSVDNAYLPAVGEMVSRRQLAVEPFDAVIAGCLQDTEQVAIETRSQLEDYCYHVAGAVGLCCIGIWGYAGQRLPGTEVDKRRAEELAILTGFAFQLTNILRDLKEDAASGRRYLPTDDLERFDCSEELLSKSVAGDLPDPLVQLLAYEVNEAHRAYAESAELSKYLSRPGRRILAAMRAIYGGLLREIDRRHYDVFSRRVSLSRLAKVQAVLSAWYRG